MFLIVVLGARRAVAMSRERELTTGLPRLQLSVVIAVCSSSRASRVTAGRAATFDDLPADADEPTRQDLAERLLPLTLYLRSRLPGLPDATTSSGAAASAARTIDVAVGDLYNPAQIDVLRRIRHLRRALPHPDPELFRPDTSRRVSVVPPRASTFARAPARI